MSISADQNENRLSDTDRERYMGELNLWISGNPEVVGTTLNVDQIAMIRRVLFNILGCRENDLRDSEIKEIDDALIATLDKAGIDHNYIFTVGR